MPDSKRNEKLKCHVPNCSQRAGIGDIVLVSENEAAWLICWLILKLQMIQLSAIIQPAIPMVILLQDLLIGEIAQ
jgi:hypothetical protein